jgi:TPR repeat protein
MACVAIAQPFMSTAPAKALPLFKKGCETGDGISCALLAGAFKDGLGVTANPRAALMLNQRSCKLDYFKGCYNLGLQLFNGEGVPADEAAGIAALEKACTGKAWRACGSLGDYYLTTGKKDKALPILKLGCDNADRLSCETLAKAT